MEAFRPEYRQPVSQPGEALDEVIARVEEGYPFAAYLALAKRLDISQAQLAEVLNISSSTLQQRRGRHFSVVESGRIYQLERLVALAEKAIGDAEDARRWLKSPNLNLGMAPLTLARTAPGLGALTRYLEQIAAGVYL